MLSEKTIHLKVGSRFLVEMLFTDKKKKKYLQTSSLEDLNFQILVKMQKKVIIKKS